MTGFMTIEMNSRSYDVTKRKLRGISTTPSEPHFLAKFERIVYILWRFKAPPEFSSLYY